MADYNKIGLLAIRDGRMLLCRKNRTTSKLILPGGCLEAGESPEECLAREIAEELGGARVTGLEYIATYSDRAASDDPSVVKTVEIRLYRGQLTDPLVPTSEIVELVWFSPDDDWSTLAPSLANKILPDLLQRALLHKTRPAH